MLGPSSAQKERDFTVNITTQRNNLYAALIAERDQRQIGEPFNGAAARASGTATLTPSSSSPAPRYQRRPAEEHLGCADPSITHFNSISPTTGVEPRKFSHIWQSGIDSFLDLRWFKSTGLQKHLIFSLRLRTGRLVALGI